ncbi:transposase [Moorena sp. SIO3A2]|uniref:transposase n=1 Tax=Moorena sp. SIO3A2 TaxID=2607841 RepID=UPI0013BD497B|nr:transposase [Moorena sp. SIO3A2]
MNRGNLSNQHWERLKPLLPQQKPHTGKPNKEQRTVINRILWVLRTDTPSGDLPRDYGKLQSVATRF